MVVIELDNEIEQELNKYAGVFAMAPKEAGMAYSRALFKTTNTLKSKVIKHTMEDYAVLKSRLDSTIWTSRKGSGIQAEVTLKAKSGQTRIKYLGKAFSHKGVGVIVKKGDIRYELSAFQLRGSWYKRKTDEKYPVTTLFGPSTPQMILNKGALDTSIEEWKSSMRSAFEYEFTQGVWRNIK